jgi:hypothetical protein
MNHQAEDRVVQTLRKFYETDDDAQRFFKWAASRQDNDIAETDVDDIAHVLLDNRAQAVALCRHLDKIKCGQFVVGRKGSKSRIRWSYGLRNLSEVATGKAAGLKAIDNKAFISDDRDVSEELVKIQSVSKTLEFPRGSQSPRHPLIQGLFQSLPSEDEGWSVEEAARWLQAAALNFRYVYKFNGTINIEPSKDT